MRVSLIESADSSHPDPETTVSDPEAATSRLLFHFYCLLLSANTQSNLPCPGSALNISFLQILPKIISPGVQVLCCLTTIFPWTMLYFWKLLDCHPTLCQAEFTLKSRTMSVHLAEVSLRDLLFANSSYPSHSKRFLKNGNWLITYQTHFAFTYIIMPEWLFYFESPSEVSSAE